MKQKIKILSYDEFVDAERIEDIPSADPGSDNWDTVLGNGRHLKPDKENYKDYIIWAKTAHTKLGRYLKGEN